LRARVLPRSVSVGWADARVRKKMNAVAITDAVQCFFLLLSFFAVPILLEWKYGGFTGVFGSGTGEDQGSAGCGARGVLDPLGGLARPP
jgi:Na+/proline symporter